jgi:hypothetical protein
MRSDSFQNLIMEMTLLPERWSVRRNEPALLFTYSYSAWRQIERYDGIEIRPYWFFGKVENSRSGHVFALSIRQGYLLRKLIRSILREREVIREEKAATEIHRLTSTLPEERSK